MARIDNAEQGAKAWQDAAIELADGVHAWLTTIGAALGCSADFPSILAAAQAQKQGNVENVRIVDVAA